MQGLTLVFQEFSLQRFRVFYSPCAIVIFSYCLLTLLKPGGSLDCLMTIGRKGALETMKRGFVSIFLILKEFTWIFQSKR